MPVRFGNIPGYAGPQARPGPRNFVQGINDPNTIPYQVPKALQFAQGLNNFMDAFKQQKDAQKAAADRKLKQVWALREAGVLGEHMDNKKVAKIVKDSSLGDIVDFEGKSPEEKAALQNQQSMQSMMMPQQGGGQAVPQQLMPGGGGGAPPSISRGAPRPAPQAQFSMADPQAQQQWEKTYRPGFWGKVGRAMGLSRPAPIAEGAGVYKMLEDIDKRLEGKRTMQERMQGVQGFILELQEKALKDNDPGAWVKLSQLGVAEAGTPMQLANLIKTTNPGMDGGEAYQRAAKHLVAKLGTDPKVQANKLATIQKLSEQFGPGSLEAVVKYVNESYKAIENPESEVNPKRLAKLRQQMGMSLEQQANIREVSLGLMQRYKGLAYSPTLAQAAATSIVVGNTELADTILKHFPTYSDAEFAMDAERHNLELNKHELAKMRYNLSTKQQMLQVLKESRIINNEVVDRIYKQLEAEDGVSNEQRAALEGGLVELTNDLMGNYYETRGLPRPENPVFQTYEQIHGIFDSIFGIPDYVPRGITMSIAEDYPSAKEVVNRLQEDGLMPKIPKSPIPQIQEGGVPLGFSPGGFYPPPRGMTPSLR